MLESMGSKNQALSVFYMMLAVVCYSIIPILIKVGNAEGSPFLFTGIRQIFIGTITGIAVIVIKKALVKRNVIGDINLKVISSNWSPRITALFIASISGTCAFVLLAFGLAYIDVSMAAILYETWPVFFILLMSFLFYEKTKKRDEQRYNPITASTLVFIALAVIGIALVTLSHNDAENPLSLIVVDFTGQWTAAFGVSLVLLAAIGGAAQGGCELKMAEIFAKKHSRPEFLNAEEIVLVAIMASMTEIVAGTVLCLVGLIVSETISTHQLIFTIFTGVGLTIGNVFFRASMLKTKDLGVAALSYLAPLITLIWLVVLSLLVVPHVDYLIIGAMGIVSANLLINARADKRIAYGALVVSLWLFGTITYFYEGQVTDVPLELPVTIFILVMSFRVDRLARRTAQEENWVFDAFQKLKVMADRKQVDYRAGEALLKIDRHKSAEELAAAYRQLTRKLDGAGRRVSTRERSDARSADIRNEIAGVRQMVDSLAHSRQQGAHFGELVAIFFAGALIVGGLLFFNGERDVYSDFTSFLLSSVVVFLFFNIVDLHNDRRDPILIGNRRRYEVKLDMAVSKYSQQRISVVVSVAIVVVFGFLFAAT